MSLYEEMEDQNRRRNEYTDDHDRRMRIKDERIAELEAECCGYRSMRDNVAANGAALDRLRLNRIAKLEAQLADLKRAIGTCQCTHGWDSHPVNSCTECPCEYWNTEDEAGAESLGGELEAVQLLNDDLNKRLDAANERIAELERETRYTPLVEEIQRDKKRIAELESVVDLRTWVKETLDDIEHEAMSEPRVTRLLKRIDQLEAAAAAREKELAEMREAFDKAEDDIPKATP